MSTTVNFQIVVAAALNNGIGKENDLPWRLKHDMEYFKELTTKTKDFSRKNVVIMGRKTWESIPAKFRPLPGRINIVLTRGDSILGDESSDLFIRPSLTAALELAATLRDRTEHVFVIGGGQVYTEAVQHPNCTAIHLTRVELPGSDCTVFFPPLTPPLTPSADETARPSGGVTSSSSPSSPSSSPSSLETSPAPLHKLFRLWSTSKPHRENGVRFHFLCYTRVPSASIEGPSALSSPSPSPSVVKSSPAVLLPSAVRSAHEELQYLDMIREAMDEGAMRGDRTGTGTVSVFGRTMTFNLRHGTFPLLTTKRVFWRGMAEELLWFISGKTDAKLLKSRNVRIWDGNSSRCYLDSIGLSHREEGDLGPVYGFQWRHFGAEYGTMHDDYTDKGVDQLMDIINRIKKNPNDRRLVMTAWNPAALQDMALPPCHMICQFYVADGEVSCMMNQRSCDMGLGVPFNIASYALLTRLIAQVCGLKPGDFIHVLGDTHVYCNHIEPLRKQLENEPRHLPALHINPNVKDIDKFTFEDFTLEGYDPHAPIKMEMAV